MSKLFIQFITVIMSILCALNVGPASSTSKQVQTRNLTVVEATEETPESEDYGLTEEKTGTENEDKTEENKEEAIVTEENTIIDNQEAEATGDTVAEESRQLDNTPDKDIAENQEDGQVTENTEAASAENTDVTPAEEAQTAEDVDLSDYEVVETIDISATENDNVTMTLYAAPTENKTVSFAMTNKATVDFKESKGRAATNEVEQVTAVVSGDGDMQENVFRYFVDVERFIYMAREALATEYDLKVEEVNYTLPEDIDIEDFIDVDDNIRYFAGADCKAGPEGTELFISDETRENGIYVNALKYSPTAIEFAEDSNVTSISSCAFIFCDELENVVIPDTVKEIGDSAFAYCTSLESVVIPEGVERISACAFYQCRNLSEIVLPSTINHIDDMAFVNIKQDSVIKCPTEYIYTLVISGGGMINPDLTTVICTADNN